MTAVVLPYPIPYSCPTTGSALTLNGGMLCSAGNATRYPIRSGVAIFRNRPPTETEDDTRRLLLLNELAPTIGWREALYEVHRGESDAVRYVTDEDRAAYLDLLPIRSSSRLLEVGTSLGQFTPMLAQRAAHVCGLEVVEEQARFTYHRCHQMGRTNVAIACGGEDCRLPYLNQAFDGVILNLVLEWCGARATDESHAILQRRMLSEVSRVLTPGGFAFISTKNRYGLRLLLGKRDRHANDLRFGNALPRWLMFTLLSMSRKGRPSGLLWSRRELIGMLEGAGFDRIESFWAAPDMRFPDRYIPDDAASVRAARREGGFRQENGRLLGAMMKFVPSYLVRHLAHGHVFLVYKAATTVGKVL